MMTIADVTARVWWNDAVWAEGRARILLEQTAERRIRLTRKDGAYNPAELLELVLDWIPDAVERRLELERENQELRDRLAELTA